MKLVALATTKARRDRGIDLADFLPDRLTVLSNRISRCLGRLYGVRFGLLNSERWVLAAIAHCPGVSAHAVCELIAMDKVQVSRAVSRLLASGHIIRRADARDRRRAKLFLSEKGREAHDQIVAVVQAYGTKLCARFSDEETRTFEHMLEKLENAADDIAAQGFGLAVGLDTKARRRLRS